MGAEREKQTPRDNEPRCNLECNTVDCQCCENRIYPMGYSTEYSQEFDDWLELVSACEKAAPYLQDWRDSMAWLDQQ